MVLVGCFYIQIDHTILVSFSSFLYIFCAQSYKFLLTYHSKKKKKVLVKKKFLLNFSTYYVFAHMGHSI